MATKAAATPGHVVGARDPGVVTGGDGWTSLALDLSQTSGAFVHIVSNGARGFSGTVVTATTTSFADIRALSIILSPGYDHVRVDAAALAGRSTLALDGGDSEDSLSIDFTKVRNVVFEVDPLGTIRSSHGSFRGFEHFSISLGGGVNSVDTGRDSLVGASVSSNGGINSIVTGAATDEIHSTGIDRVDAGENYDFWTGDYASSKVDLRFEMTDRSGFLSNGTTLTNVESFSLYTGSGNDSFVIRNPSCFVGSSIYAGSGVDTLNVDFSAFSSHNVCTINSNGERGFSGVLLSSGAQLEFSGIEKLSFIATYEDDLIEIDANASRAGAKLVIDGAGGFDVVSLHGQLAGFSIIAGEAGGYVINDIDRSDGDRGTFSIRNIERISFDDGSLDLVPSGGALVDAFGGEQLPVVAGTIWA